MEHVFTVRHGAEGRLFLECSCSGAELATWLWETPLVELTEVAHEHITNCERIPPHST